MGPHQRLSSKQEITFGPCTSIGVGKLDPYLGMWRKRVTLLFTLHLCISWSSGKGGVFYVEAGGRVHPVATLLLSTVVNR